MRARIARTWAKLGRRHPFARRETTRVRRVPRTRSSITDRGHALTRISPAFFLACSPTEIGSPEVLASRALLDEVIRASRSFLLVTLGAFAALTGVTACGDNHGSAPDASLGPACSDGVDNDGDGATD